MKKIIKDTLKLPYTQTEKNDFICQSRRNGYSTEILEDDSLQSYVTELTENEEKERVAMLKMTPREFLLAIVEMGVDYSKIKELMSANPRVEIEMQYCNFVYRGNPLLDKLCGKFRVTTEQLDELFKAKGF